MLSTRAPPGGVTRRSGGIGRRASLRGWCPQGRGGSSPPSDTVRSTWADMGLCDDDPPSLLVPEAQSELVVEARLSRGLCARERTHRSLHASDENLDLGRGCPLAGRGMHQLLLSSTALAGYLSEPCLYTLDSHA